MTKIITFIFISLLTFGCVSAKTVKATEGVVLRTLFSLATPD